MFSRCTSSITKEDVVFPKLLYCDSRCSQTDNLCFHVSCRYSYVCLQACHSHSQACRRHTQACYWHTQAFGWHCQACRWHFQTCRQHSQACRRHPQACRRHSQASRLGTQVLLGAPKVLSGPPRCSQPNQKHSHCSPVQVIRDPSYSEGRQVCPPRVWYFPEIDAAKFTLHIHSVTPGDFQWLKYILLMPLWS